MWPFFVLWDFWFWSFFGVFIIFEFVWTNKSNGVAGLLTPFGFLALLFLFSSFNPFSWIAENWQNLWIYGLGYIVIGLVWSFFHWLRFVQKRADFLGEFLDVFRKDNNLASDWMPQENPKEEYQGRGVSTKRDFSSSFWEKLARNWSETFPNRTFGRCGSDATFENIIPQATNHKDDLVAWMSLWPFDMAWMLLSDIMIEIWNWLFSRFRLAYQKVANRAFRKYMPKEPMIPATQLVKKYPDNDKAEG